MQRATLLGLAGLALFVVACGGDDNSRERVSITVKSPSRLIDSPVRVAVRGLGAHQTAQLRAKWKAFGGTSWASRVQLRPDANGRIDLHGIDGMRFLWAMRPTGPHAGDAAVFGPPVRGADDVTITVVVDGRSAARARLPRRVTPASIDLRRLTVKRDGVFGFYLSAHRARRRPAVLLLGGSEGGAGMIDAAGLLAAHGYPSMALAYFDAPGLPTRLTRIPLEYFERALRLLRRQPQVDPDHTVVLGASRGGEAALLLASSFPRLLHGAIALVPSSETGDSPADPGTAAWTYHGRPLPLRPIAVERITGPILTAAAGQDSVWPSTIYSDQIERRLQTHHFRFGHERLSYPRAGHDIGGAIPYLPQPDPIRFGGSHRASAAAKADLWPHILDYLRRLNAHPGLAREPV
jgi:dienelactone hydrolase